MATKAHNSIRVETEELEALGGVKAVHTVIVFNIDGHEYRVEGYPFNTETGTPVSASVLDDFRLKAKVTAPAADTVIMPPDYQPISGASKSEEPALQVKKDDEAAKPNKVLSSTEIFAGDSAAVVEKFAKALEAANAINLRDIQYVSVGLIVPGQNCNSVTDTIVAAMGLRYDMPDVDRFDPGRGRMLIATGQPSQFDGLADAIRAEGRVPATSRAIIEELFHGATSTVITDQMLKAREYGQHPELVVNIQALRQSNNGFITPSEHVQPRGEEFFRHVLGELLDDKRVRDRYDPKPSQLRF